MCIQLREDLSILEEYCGNTGWNRVVIIGEKQDDLRKKGLPCTAKDVSKALSHIKWGSGRDVGEDAAQKVCMIWQRLKHLPKHKGIILSSYALYGKKSFFEESSKLLLCLQKAPNELDLLWVMEDMLRSILYDLAEAETSAEIQRHYSVLVRFLWQCRNIKTSFYRNIKHYSVLVRHVAFYLVGPMSANGVHGLPALGLLLCPLHRLHSLFNHSTKPHRQFVDIVSMTYRDCENAVRTC